MRCLASVVFFVALSGLGCTSFKSLPDGSSGPSVDSAADQGHPVDLPADAIDSSAPDVLVGTGGGGGSRGGSGGTGTGGMVAVDSGGNGGGSGGAGTGGRGGGSGANGGAAGGGGVVNTGAVPGSGGRTGGGGAPVNGGATGSGGTPGSGGAVSSGGTPGSGGTVGSGGAPVMCTGTTLDLCGTQCVNKQTDGKHCGACGHDCLGGGCSVGVCLPVVLASVEARPYSLAVDSTQVFWRYDGVGHTAIMRSSKFGASTAVALASPQTGSGSLGLSTGRISWCSGDEIRYCSLPDCPDGWKVLASSQTNCYAVTADAASGTAFWTISTPYNTTTGGAIRSAPASGTPVAPIGGADLPHPLAVVVSGDNVFWASAGTFTNDIYNFDGAVVRYSRSSGTATSLSRGPWLNQPLYLSVTSNRVFFVAGARILSTPLPNGSGSAMAQVVSDPTFSGSAVAADETSFYWLDGPNVNRCPSSGCNGPLVVHAVGQQLAYTIAQDTTAVYWGTWDSLQQTGAVVKVAK